MTSSPPKPQKKYYNKYLKAWGGGSRLSLVKISSSLTVPPIESAVPPTALASMILAQSIRPVKYLGLAFPPVLLFGSWCNVMGAKADAAGITGGWSLLYLLLSRRARLPPAQLYKTARGYLRLGTQGMCWMNVACCGYVYVKKKGFRLNGPHLPS